MSDSELDDFFQHWLTDADYSSPLRPSYSAANRGPGNNVNRRKRSREPDDETSSVAPPSSRKSDEPPSSFMDMN